MVRRLRVPRTVIAQRDSAARRGCTPAVLAQSTAVGPHALIAAMDHHVHVGSVVVDGAIALVLRRRDVRGEKLTLNREQATCTAKVAMVDVALDRLALQACAARHGYAYFSSVHAFPPQNQAFAIPLRRCLKSRSFKLSPNPQNCATNANTRR